MSKQDRAAKAIKFAAARGYTPEQTATLLNELNLLAPDLPEPSYIVTECDERSLVWEPCGPEYVVTLYKEPITGRYIIGVDDSPYALRPQEARELGLALLAAASYTENQRG